MSRPKLSAHDAALKLLARRSHSVKEVARKLHQKGYLPPDIDAVLADFQARNWLNDENFAHSRARYRATLSKWGPQRIKLELHQAGVAEAYITAALAALEEAPEHSLDHVDFDENALALLQRKYGPWPAELATKPALPEARAAWFKQREKEKARRMNFLMRRGFSASTAQAALAAIIEGA